MVEVGRTRRRAHAYEAKCAHLDRFTSDYPVSLKTLKKETHTNQFPQLIENKYVCCWLVRWCFIFLVFFVVFICVRAGGGVLCATT